MQGSGSGDQLVGREMAVVVLSTLGTKLRNYLLLVYKKTEPRRCFRFYLSAGTAIRRSLLRDKMVLHAALPCVLASLATSTHRLTF